MNPGLKLAATDLSPEEVELKVEIPPERVETAMQAAFKRLVKRYRIPGFRPGRAPRSVFERQIGREVLLQDATDALLPVVYDEALEEAAITPFETGKVSDVKNRDDGGIDFTVKVFRRPEVSLPDLNQIQMDDEPAGNLDEEIDHRLLEMRRAQAALVPIDVADATSTLTVSGEVKTEGRESPEAFKDLTLHMEDALAAVRAALLGARIGEEREATYSQDDKQHHAHFHVDNVGRMELPPEDDDFASSLGFAGLKELRADLTNYVRTSDERRRREARAQRILEACRAEAGVKAPEFLIEREVEHLRDHHDARTKPDDEVRAEARDRVERMLVADAIIEDQKIRVTQEELRQAAVALMERGDRKSLTEDEMRTLARVLLDEKLTTFLAGVGKTEGSATGTVDPSAEPSSEKGAGSQ